MSIRTRADDNVGLSSLDPARAPARDAAGFRRIIAARKRLAEAERELHDAVAAAGLFSESEGTEPQRRVVVQPAR